MNETLKCKICNHYCVIEIGQKGICKTRINKNGSIHSLIYGQIISEAIDPIEKKPLYHFLPRTFTYSYATVGCNFRCENCHNWEISQYPRITGNVIGKKTKPQNIVQRAVEAECPSISATYTEPTLALEFNLEVMQLAKKAGLKNIWVSNGYMSQETRKEILPYLDATNIDLKYFDEQSYKKYCGAKLEPILDNLKYFKKNNVWVEVTTLIIPQRSDSEIMLKKIAKFIYQELGADTPWHVSRFAPEISYQLQYLSPTPIRVIEKAIKIGKQVGLKNIYPGNISINSI
jgi:pyruvate formate lyase activating enzyme